MLKNAYLQRVYDQVIARDPDQPEFHQCIREFLESLEGIVDKHPEWEKNAILERFIEPDRIITFRVTWVDDAGKVQVNRGYRVQYNSAIGPYKGGLRFHPSVNLSIIKFLGFEMNLKNGLTTLPIGASFAGPSASTRILLRVRTRMNTMNAMIRKLMMALMNAPKSMPFSVPGTGMVSPAISASPPPVTSLISGLMMSLVSDVTIEVNAPPTITPTAMSITLPRLMNSLNSERNDICISILLVLVAIAVVGCIPALQGAENPSRRV